MSALAGLASVGCLLAVGGCASVPPPTPPQLAYCSQLYQLYFQYHTVITYAHDGQRARAELALQSCSDGDYAAGIEELSDLLSRHRVPVPPSHGRVGARSMAPLFELQPVSG
jgi:hypothetical protein